MSSSWADAVAARRGLVITAIVLVVGVSLGLAFPPAGSRFPQPWATASGVVGWVYFAAWSVSFWPQVFINASRRSVVGLSLDFTALNILGFAAYTSYNVAYFFSPHVRAEYAAANGGSLPGVQSNDVFFALHAVTLTVIVGAQAVVYDRGGQSVALLTRVMLAAGVLFAVVYGGLAAAYDGQGGGPRGAFTWLNYLLALSYMKLAISMAKYVPQVVLNARRRSTVGWSIENVLLDITGGTLSVLQQVGDAASVGDWSIVSGDPVKFGLGFVSIVFDVVFIVQHFVLYRAARDKAGEGGGDERGRYEALNSAAAAAGDVE